MTMAVEIYDERELNPETLTNEPDAEALQLIEELGLKAQKNDDGRRIAYPNPTADQMFVISILFPARTPLDRYDAGAIPLRVLKEIRYYKSENPTHQLYVCHAPPAAVKDPILMAYTGQYGFEWDGDTSKRRLIARWGDGLAPWSELLQSAKKIAADRAEETLERIIIRANALRDMIKATGTWDNVNMPELGNIPTGW